MSIEDNKANIAIIGSRNFTDFAKLETEMENALKEWNLTTSNINRIVSGGARGADTLADMYAKKHNLVMTTYIPDWKAFGKAAGVMRNTDIINDSDYVVAFPSRQGRGTQDSIRKAQKKLLTEKVKVVYID